MSFEESDLVTLTKINELQSRVIIQQDEKIMDLTDRIQKLEKSHFDELKKLQNCTSSVMRLQSMEIESLRMEIIILQEFIDENER